MADLLLIDIALTDMYVKLEYILKSKMSFTTTYMYISDK